MLHECYVLGHDQDQDGAGIVVQSLSRVQLFATPWTAARQAGPSPTPGVYSNSYPFSQ